MQEPWKKAKEEYQNQPLPPQLDMRVKQAIAQGQSPARKVPGICTECGEFAGDRRISADRDGCADR